MAFVPGYNSRFFVGSQRWSVYARGVTAASDVAQLDTSTLENQAQVFINGQKVTNAQLDMLLDSVGSGQFALLNTWIGTPQPLTIGFDGCDAGDVTWMMLGNQSNATVSSPVNDVVTATVGVQGDGGIDWGKVVAAETAITADTNGASLDNGAATSNGGVAHLHVTAFSGLTSNDITIEHSTNGSVWATLGTFTQVTGATSQRLTIAAGTTVNRYLRVVDNVTGTGSCTRAVAFARR